MVSPARNFFITSLVLLSLATPTFPCGPGGGAGRRRAGKKLTPLVFKQHVPNVSENSLGGSGPSEGKIVPADPRFTGLVVNNSPDVLFKDADGSGSDRVMSQRCKEKLNTLSILVINQWPGVKVRVTAGWADNPVLGSTDSLHYEGRAVDITTSDRDRSKYGMLARLAVEAGFDWVYYESRGHIHCSVKSDSSIAIGSHGCFPRHSTARLEDGRTVHMEELAVGDRVMTFDPDTGRLQFDHVVAFLDRSEVANPGTVYLTVETESGQRLQLTTEHLIYSTMKQSAQWPPDANDSLPVFADRLQTGNYVFVTANSSSTSSAADVFPAKISRISRVPASRDLGVFAPLTERGTIVVDDVIVSCYASFGRHDIAHVTTSPLRFAALLHRSLVQLFPFPVLTDTAADGVHWYARTLRTAAEWVVPSDWWYSVQPSV